MKEARSESVGDQPVRVTVFVRGQVQGVGGSAGGPRRARARTRVWPGTRATPTTAGRGRGQARVWRWLRLVSLLGEQPSHTRRPGTSRASRRHPRGIAAGRPQRVPRALSPGPAAPPSCHPQHHDVRRAGCRPVDRRRDGPSRTCTHRAEATCCRHDDACRRRSTSASVGINRKALVPRGPALPHRSTSLWSSLSSPSATGQSTTGSASRHTAGWWTPGEARHLPSRDGAGERRPAELACLRGSIDNIDARSNLLAERFKCTRAVGRLKGRCRYAARWPRPRGAADRRLRALADDAGLGQNSPRSSSTSSSPR